MENPGPDSKGDHRHKRHRPAGDTVEGGGGAYGHSPLRQTTDARRPPQVQVRNRDGDGYNGVKPRPGFLQNRPVPPLLGIPGTLEVLQHRRQRPPPHYTGGVWSGSLDVWDFGNFLGMPAGGAKAERLPRAGLIRNEGYNTGRARVPDAVQHGGKKLHKKLAGHDGRIPSGVSGRTGRDRWAVLGSLIFQR